ELYEPVEVLGMVKYLVAKSQAFEPIQPSDGYGSGDEDQIARGKQAFEIRGCLACHSHSDFPVAQATKGPDLSNIGDKFAAAAGAPSPREWLYSWVTLPSHYHVRSTMPDLFLDPVTDAEGNVTDPAADITAYLLSCSNGWTPVGAPQIDAQTLDQFVLENLQQPFTLKEAERYLQEGIPAEMRAKLKGAEVELVGSINDEMKLLYAGRKAIGKYGCYACHDIPGFENAKPIGTALADWGRKESSKLAFEHILEYLHSGHGHGHADGTGHASETGEHVDDEHADHGAADDEAEEDEEAGDEEADSLDHNEPFDESFYTMHLNSGDRIGFIWQKLKEPRSYDFKKTENKRYDERLRMPLFPLDAQEREQVITFVLGLVAEPPAEEFVYQPDERQLAMIRGRRVLDKYNCAGCHYLNTEKWVVEFEPGAFEEPNEVTDFPFMQAHVAPSVVDQTLKADAKRGVLTAELFGFQEIDNNLGTPVIADEEGLPLEDDIEEYDAATLQYPMVLWEPAVIEGQVYDVKSRVSVPIADIKQRVPAWGGDLTRWLLPRVVELEKEANPGANGTEAWGWLPPPLVGQGAKVQAGWLHDFLLDPHPIRPAAYLRMPRFNMSSEEATDLVNFFMARDNVEYPFQFDPRTRATHLVAEEAEFAAKEGASGDLGHLDAAMNIVVSNDYCVKCHLVGDFEPQGSDRAKAPDLSEVYSRLRPEYMRRWIANPAKILPYTSMPQNIPFDPESDTLGGMAQTLYPGTSIEQLDALVDLLSNYADYTSRKADISELVKQAAPPPAGGGDENAAAEGDSADADEGDE
ncbi:MAG: c-type cytochrome, partial [Planctomycetales bacterium]|nr:c-type cytochrome [Planctomycetales bacterium]